LEIFDFYWKKGSMKITGARSETFAALGGRVRVRAAGPIPAASADKIEFLGLSQADLSPAVQAALGSLLGELEDLRGQVSQLKAKLAEVEGLADRDALTPLLNRRAFIRELSRVRTYSQRYGAPASLVYFDVDGFKGVNDRYGHAAGDACLHAVAERLSANVRESDVVGRMGGDEFAVILVQADRLTAEAKAEGLAKAIEGAPVRFDGWTAPLRISYGVREISAEIEPEMLVAEADAAMFDRKRERRGAIPAQFPHP
jgi:diguanylate cyclase (GGDEF)-like protein